jgi:hypothetical protein
MGRRGGSPLRPGAITSHGLRVGAATDLAEAGVSGRRLARAGRWRENSTVPERVYVRPLRDGDDNPSADVDA